MCCDTVKVVSGVWEGRGYFHTNIDKYVLLRGILASRTKTLATARIWLLPTFLRRIKQMSSLNIRATIDRNVEYRWKEFHLPLIQSWALPIEFRYSDNNRTKRNLSE
jgi:hypothetical protein